MKVVKNNVESKGKILEYLKSINFNCSNKHEEIELNNYIASIVMIITNSSTLNTSNEEFNIYLLFQDKNNNKIYDKFFNKEFTNKGEAEEYYIYLKNKVNSFTDKDVYDLI